MIKNFIVLRIYRILRWRFVDLKNRINEKKKKPGDNENVTSFEDFDTNEGKGWKTTPSICVKCLNRSVQVYPVGMHLSDFECGCCGRIGSLIVDIESLEEEGE
jgi:hypothetical protein